MPGDDHSAAPYALPNVRWAEVGVLALDGLTAMVRSVHQRVSSPDYAAAQRAAEGQDVILEQLAKKKRLQDFAELFDKGEFKKAVAFILTPPADGTAVVEEGAGGDGSDRRQVDCFGLGKGSSGWDLGEFLFRYKNSLDRTAIGDFLGELGKEPIKPTPAEDPDGTLTAQWEEDRRDDYKVPMSVRFFQQVLKGFLNCFNCQGKSLIRAIREVMYQMKLPGESQKIDRVMETFANHWFSVNKEAGPEVNPFTSVDGAFILAFSIIMLNTDLHSGKMAKVMSKDEFKRMNRGIDNGNSLPDEYLNEIYDDVRANQIVMIDMIKQGYSNDSVWTLEVMEAKSRAAHDLPIGLRTNSSSQLAALDPFVFNVMWRPSVAALLTVLTNVCAACDGHGSPLAARNVTSLKSVWSVLKAESKKNYDVIRAALEGILRCAETASILGNVPALDFIVTSLAQEVIPPFQQWLKCRDPSMYGKAGRSVLVLVASHLLMKVVDRFGSDMVEGWAPFCEVWQLMFLCGVFSDDGSDPSFTAQASEVSVSEASPSPARVSRSPHRVEPALRPVLRSSPLQNTIGRRTDAPVAQVHGGGWFSGLWGGNNQMLIDEQRREQLEEDRAALSRLRSSIPSLTEMFQMRFTDEGLARLIHNLCLLGEVGHSAHTEGGAMVLKVDPAKAFASSYLAQIVVEVAIFDVHRVNFNESNVFAFLRSLMSVSFGMLQQAGGVGVSAPQTPPPPGAPPAPAIRITPASREEIAYWKSVSDRVVDAVMALINALSRSEATRESLFLLLSDLTALPEHLFKLVIAEPLGRLLANLLEPQHVAGVPEEIDDGASNTSSQGGSSPCDAAMSGAAANARHPLRSCTREGWTRLIGAARMVAVRAPSQGLRMLALRVLVLMAREASIGDWATLAHLQGIAMSIAEVLALDPIHAANSNNSAYNSSNGSIGEAFEIIQRGDVASPGGLSFMGGSGASLARYEAVADQAPEALIMLHKTIVSSRFMPSPSSSSGAFSSPSGSSVEEWTSAWLTCIGALATLAASVPNDKIASDALLATQRCILDDRLLLLDAQQVMRLFHSVLLPLMETVCNTSIAAERGHAAVIVQNAAGAPADASAAQGADGGFRSFFLPSVLISAVFGPMAGPDKKKAASQPSASIGSSSPTPSVSAEMALLGAASPTTVAIQSFRPPQKLAIARNDEVQCRCIGLVPKALLHFTDKLVTSPASMVSADGAAQPLMTALWREVIGTLYALYSGGTADSVLLDAITENIRNVVHVLVALCSKGSDKSLALARTNPQFWHITKSLLGPFPFSAALLTHIEEHCPTLV